MLVHQEIFWMMFLLGQTFPQFSLISSHSETLGYDVSALILGPSSGWISKKTATAFQILGKGTLTETLYIFEIKPFKELDARERNMSWSISKIKLNRRSMYSCSCMNHDTWNLSKNETEWSLTPHEWTPTPLYTATWHANQQALARLGSVKWGSEFVHEGQRSFGFVFR